MSTERDETAEAPRRDVLADALERHNALGGHCTCGADLPVGRLDTPRWFAEHLADVVRSVTPPGSGRTTDGADQ